MSRLSTVIIAAIALMTLAHSPAQTPSPPKFRLVRDIVSGTQPPQWVFLLIHPDGHAGVVAPSYLQQYVEAIVPEGATLEWDPGCVRMGGEPMDSADETEAFATFCGERKIRFRRVPSG